MNVTLTQLRYLVAVARHGSVTGAAKVLNVSQPSISVAINAVEKNFGQKLFVRQRGSGVSPTSFGRAVVAKARQVLTETDELISLGSSKSAVSGELVLGCFEDLAPFFAPALLRAFSERYPAVKVVVRDETFETLGRRLGDAAMISASPMTSACRHISPASCCANFVRMRCCRQAMPWRIARRSALPILPPIR
jgi:DNA-binding transcriptional LysR family regulator